jgi:hypothetical protein
MPLCFEHGHSAFADLRRAPSSECSLDNVPELQPVMLLSEPSHPVISRPCFILLKFVDFKGITFVRMGFSKAQYASCSMGELRGRANARTLQFIY